jgi:hypothetical protein
MKAILTICILVLPIFSFSQQLQLEISNPQPRLGQVFTLSVNVDTLSSMFFKSSNNKFNASQSSSSNHLFSVDYIAEKLGNNQIAPFMLNFNGTSYTTNALKFEIIDSLPPVNKGLWIRKVRFNDSLVCIIIEQRMPAKEYITTNGNSKNITTKAADNESPVEIKRNDITGVADQIENVSFEGSTVTTGTQIITSYTSKEQLDCSYSFAIYKFKVTDKSKPAIITKDIFNNLPDYYQFKDIVLN